MTEKGKVESIKSLSTDSQLNWSKCLCHVTDSSEKLTLFTEKSWKKFLECSQRRKDQVWIAMENHFNDGPKGGYHRKCYQRYTNVGHISRIEGAVSKAIPSSHADVQGECEEPPAKRLHRSDVDEFDINKCVICQKEKGKTGNEGQRVKETLTLNISEYGSEALLRAAVIRNDDSVLLQIQGQDCIAREIKYHRSCYKNYVRSDRLAKLEAEDCDKEDKECNGYKKAFDKVRHYVEAEVIAKYRVVTMSALTQKFVSHLIQEGIEVGGYRASKLKLRLKCAFGEQLAFQKPRNARQSELVYYARVKKGEIVEHMFLKSSMPEDESEITEPKDKQETDNITCQMYHTSKQLRSLLVDLKPVIPWPPSPDDLDSDAGLVPDLLYNMLAWILTSDAEYSSQRVRNLPSHVHRWILSLGQDLIHCVTRGRIKTVKHTLLPITVKSLTGNTEIITLLNRFGHGLSYSQVEELETAIAEQQISNNNDGVLLPSVCSPNVPAVFCWDNNDLQEETLSGKGTTHCTNGIVVQRKTLTCALPPDMQAAPVQAIRKRRSVTHIVTDVIPYHSGRRQSPSPMNVDINLITQMNTEISHRVRMIDYGWMLCRQPWEDTIFSLSAEQQQVMPAWTGFNTKLQKRNELRQSSIGYCPVIESSPTEQSTVFTILKRSLQMADQLNQTDVIVVLDQAIYAKALEIVWQDSVQFERVVLRLGTFHTLCALTAAIGKRFAGAGLEDVLIESGIVATGSVAGVLQGKHYNRAIRTHKIVYEALHRLQWQEFKTWLQSHGKNTNYALLVNAVQLVRNDFDPAHFEGVLSLQEFQDLADLYNTFCKDDKDGPTKIFWNSYLEMVAILLDTIRATREGDWDLHIQCIKAMIPWFFAYDHTNYARYLPVYLLHMLALPDKHPEAHKMLSQGDFGVQRTSSHGFSQLPVDQTIEQTLNRNTKTSGGIVGFSLKKRAVQRWLLTAHARASFVDRCREMAASHCQEKTSTLHKEFGSARLKKDEEDVQKVMSVISQWRNPFEKSEELVSLSSGSIADDQLQDDLLKAKDKGKSAMLLFVNDRLLSNRTGFFNPLPRMKLGRFGEVKKMFSSGGKSIVLQADRNLFARLLVIGQSRQIDVRDLLTHELGPVPWSLASFDGSLAKTNKSLIVKLLKDGVVAPQNQPRPTCVIIDAMALMQTLNRIPDRFIDLAELVLGTAVKQAGDATRIDIVADQYPAISIKNAEREKRGRSGQLSIQITSAQQLCPRQWKKFLSTGSNKTSLMKFLAEEWATNQQLTSRIIRDRTLYVTHGDTCTEITSSPQGLVIATVMEELCSNHEEADTRMFLHASHASNTGHQQILIKSSDTDVEVLACHLQENISAGIMLLSGTRNRERLVSVPSVCDKLGVELCRALPGLHALTGCDTVSAFAGKGKKAALDIVQRDESLRESICALGNHVPPREEDLRALEKFVCVLYGDPTSSSVNDTRYHLFCKKKNVQSHQLPPSHAALWKHLQRTNYQTYLWKNALVARISNQEPHGQGWRQEDQKLEIDWTDLAPAPESVMELVSCGCRGDCSTRRCSCVKNGLPCTDACSCRDSCVNCSNDIDSDSDEDSENDGSSDEEETNSF